MKEYKFKFSVIIPIYNVEKYLEETILSVVNQTIGFKENIQLILINDGSKDNSYKICEKYQKMYPNNIIYKEQENYGVSAARNKGKGYIKGKYVNFLDSDDMWDLDVFDKVYNFFEQNEKDIDVVACRQKFFEAKEGYHQLDYKFDNTHIVDILQDYEEIQLSTSSSFIKAEVIKKYKYDTRLKYAEDATLMGQVLMEKSKYGILSDAIYNYRKRKKNTSALQTREGDKNWYFYTIKYGYKVLISKSIEKYGEVIKYFQYQIMYDIQWRIKVDISKYLNTEEQKEYIQNIIELLSYIDDEIIMKQKYLWKEYKVLVLCLKYKKDIRKEFYYENDKIYFNKLKILNIKNKSLIKINNIKILYNNKIIIKGIINCLLPEEDFKIYAKLSSGEKININKYIIINNRESIKGNLNNCRKFTLEIPDKNNNIEFKIMIDYKNNKRRLNLIFDEFFNIQDKEILYVYAKRNKIIELDKNILKLKQVVRQDYQIAKKKIVELKRLNKELEKI